MPPHPQVIPTAPLGPPGPYLLPLVVSHLGSVYHVLPLSPGPLPPRTFADLIIPDPIAFCDIMSTSPPSYPPFTAMNCLWQVMFTHIRQPQHLWSCWGPKNLGDYPSIEMLWQAWDEGSFVSEVGHQPPLRLVEKQWGHQEDQRTGKGQLQVWRPHKDNTARRKWSNFLFFIKHIETAMANGRVASEAIQDLESMCINRSMSIPALHKSLQPKHQKKGHNPSTTPGPSSI
ncbi:hypothetical protein DFH94DRAFT_631092 [Russula ochroleuca]|uniref:Uncharacterized protein n=1 Tax=Russula ochroleuca TaxID=152965 RepID=A0A9P5MWK3_9AGAM|nr:hypothetical protein DFH94DRAFT_631092 [Russula ochroleuca]